MLKLMEFDILYDWINNQGVVYWIDSHAMPLLVILIGALLAKRFGMLPLEGFIRRSIKTNRFRSEAEHKQREETLLDISESALNIVVWIVAIGLVLIELNFNMQPLLAAGGFLGIIVGFGAQNILKDVFAGVYVIAENQYQVGDVVDLDGDVGMVEDISLRMTVMRDLDGKVHHVPHGTINRASNLSKGYARVNLNIGVSYESDLEQVEKIINQVGKDLAGDPEWQNRIISPPLFLRIDNFGESAIEIKIIGETKPLEQWGVTGELRRRLKLAFDKHDITIPYPQRVIWQPRQKTPGK